MEDSSTQEKIKTKSKNEDGPSQRTLDYLMLLARSADVRKENSVPIEFDVCLN